MTAPDRVTRLREIAARLAELLDGAEHGRTLADAAALLEHEPPGAEAVVVLAAEIDRTATTLWSFANSDGAAPAAAEVAALYTEAAELLRPPPAPAPAVSGRKIAIRFPLVRPGGLVWVTASTEIGPVVIEAPAGGAVPEMSEGEARRIAFALGQEHAALTGVDVLLVMHAATAAKGGAPS